MAEHDVFLYFRSRVNQWIPCKKVSQDTGLNKKSTTRVLGTMSGRKYLDEDNSIYHFKSRGDHAERVYQLQKIS